VTQSNTKVSSLCGNNPPRGFAWEWNSVYGAYVASVENVLAGKRIRVRRTRGGYLEGTDLLVETVTHRGAHG
jgi:hypothetical protein